MKKELETILEKLKDIHYGYVDKNKNIYPDSLKDWNRNFANLYHLQSPEELIKNKYGVCGDQVELERYYLENNKIPCKSYFIIAYDKKQEPTHTFMVIENNKYYWMEHSWEPYLGIHEYSSLEELLLDVKSKFIKSIEKEKVKDYEISIYQYEKPKEHLNAIEFMNHCETGIKIK